MTLLYVILDVLLIWAILYFIVAPKEMTNIMARDPAARSYLEVILLYPGLHAVVAYRYAHFFHKHRFYLVARIISQLARFFTGIEIHPGATIGKGLFIDHGMGIVIGETAEIGDNCTIYQGVTLGGTGKDSGKRHPTIGNNVVIGTNAIVLSDIEIGDDCKIGVGSVVTKPAPPNSTIVGIPGRTLESIKKQSKQKHDLEHGKIPDPITDILNTLIKRQEELEEIVYHENRSEEDRKLMYKELKELSKENEDEE